MEIPKLICCYGGNKKIYEMSQTYGWLYGSRLPNETPCGSIYFSDNDYRHPDRKRYMAAVEKYRPYMATALDWMREDDLEIVLDWAEELSQWAEKIIIIPKVFATELLPKIINRKEVLLGYSVETAYGHTMVPLYKFKGWRVHLLGGSPHKQFRFFQKFSRLGIEVYSIDQNYICKKANTWGEYWTGKDGDGRWWRSTRIPGAAGVDKALHWSFENVKAYWEEMCMVI